MKTGLPAVSGEEIAYASGHFLKTVHCCEYISTTVS